MPAFRRPREIYMVVAEKNGREINAKAPTHRSSVYMTKFHARMQIRYYRDLYPDRPVRMIIGKVTWQDDV